MELQEQLDYIMDEFDFDRVLTAMEALDWRWLGGTPTIGDLRREARRLLTDVYSTPDYSIIATGGFTATQDSDGYLHLRFSIDEISADPDHY
jgi:hypothetical protein